MRIIKELVFNGKFTKHEENKKKQEVELAPLPESFAYPGYDHGKSYFYQSDNPAGYLFGSYKFSEETDVSQQPNFSHLQYGQHAKQSSYAENPPFYDTRYGNPHTQQQNLDYDLEAALAASMEGRNQGGINIRARFYSIWNNDT
uniref:Uncharacterized protein n=1 Tax=Meloidogyne floridensis TaxID=298350 RepID=A0A915NE71_9BILA